MMVADSLFENDTYLLFFVLILIVMDDGRRPFRLKATAKRDIES